MLTEIGSLITILKELPETPPTELAETVSRLQERLAGIAVQLEQSAILSKVLPGWLKELDSVDLYKDRLTEEDVRFLDSNLRSLSYDSVRGHLVSTFFKSSFNTLPGVEKGISTFRIDLGRLEQQLNGIPSGDMALWQKAWPAVRLRLSDLRKGAVRLNNYSSQLHSEIIHELAEAARAKRP